MVVVPIDNDVEAVLDDVEAVVDVPVVDVVDLEVLVVDEVTNIGPVEDEVVELVLVVVVGGGFC